MHIAVSLYGYTKRLKEEAESRIAASKVPYPACPFVISYRGEAVGNIRKGFAEACRRAGLVNVTPHTLRHTAGSLMAQAGIPLFMVAKVLGHNVQKTTELYAHHHPEYLRDAVNVMGSIIRSSN